MPVDLACLLRNNIYVFGIRGEGKSATHRPAALMAQKRFECDAHPYPHLSARRGAHRDPLWRERIEDAIKVVVQIRGT